MITTALLLFAGIAFGQTLEKGNLIGVHVMKVDLKSGATLDQFINFFNEKVKPEWQKADPDMTGFIMKGIRGESTNEIGMIVQYKDEAARDKYFNDDGTQSEFYSKMMEILTSVTSEWQKIGTYETKYTDWILQ